MGLNSFVKFFTPKDRIFHNLFEEIADNLCQMAILFQEGIKETDKEKRNLLLQALEEAEHKNDAATHRLFLELSQNFITPFDREDIHYLSTTLDDVADYIWASAKSILNYNISEINETMLNFSGVIINSTSELRVALKGLRNMKDIKSVTDACVKINYHENQADELLDEALKHLFLYETNAIELIRLKELYQDLEIVTDKCEDCANVIESIIVKYS